MLHLVHSNRMERLVEHLCRVLARPLAAPLAAERLVVQNTGLARWLEQRLALHFGIAGNLRFELPASFVWSLFRDCLDQVPEASPYAKEVLGWRVFDRLPGYLADPAFVPLARYLADDPDGLKRFQLARRVADTLDQYLVYRPDWIQAWEAGDGEHWQARLWRDLREAVGGGHRVELQGRFLAADLSDRELPQRVCVFGLSAMAPMSLEILRHLARFTEVYLFVLNPSPEWWGDILPDKGLARLRAAWRRRGLPDLSDYYATGNPLLAAWGRLGRDFQQLLYRDGVPDQQEAFDEEQGDSLLARVQQDLLTLYDRRAAPEPTPVPAQDDSLRIHACHSPLREVEVLHDQLLDLFQRHPDLAPRDVVVMTPDVERYAPYVQAVFGSAPPERAIPWSLADLSAAGESPLAGLVVQLLELPGSRFGASEVLGLLEIPQVQRRFGIAPGDLERIRAWVRDSGIRWGLDAAGRAGLGPEGDDINTWAFGLRRLFLGYALPEGVERYGDLAPVAGVEGGEVRLLGGLSALVERLAGLARLFATPHAARDWHAHLTRALDELLAAGDDDPGLERVRAALGRLADSAGRAGLEAPLGREVVKAWLAAELATGGAEHRYAAGRVTFCAMVPMRAVPFRVVALLGLNDRDFPRRRRPPGFDLMAGDYRPGDRSPRDEDRHLFLEALLSARDHLLLSYLGADVRDNAELQPALMLSELKDYVQAGFALAAPLVVHQPLQPFSRRYGAGEPGVLTYAAEWDLERTGGDPLPPFCAAPLAPPEEEGDGPLALETLEAFLVHPPRQFLGRRLGVWLAWEEPAAEDDEPFTLGFLTRYGLRQSLLEARVRQRDPQLAAELYRLRGELPRGAFAGLALAPEQAAVRKLGEQLAPLVEAVLPPLEVDLSLEGRRLQGWLAGVTPRGLLTYRASAFNGKDMVRLWLRHLVLNCLAGDLPRDSLHLAPEGTWRLAGWERPEPAREQLAGLLALYRDGMCRPLPLMPRSGFAYAERLHATGDPDKALKTAFGIWRGNAFRGIAGEGDDPGSRVALRGLDPWSAGLPELAQRLFGPALERLSRD